MRKLGQTALDDIICSVMLVRFSVWNLEKVYQLLHVDQSARTFLGRPLELLTVRNPMF